VCLPEFLLRFSHRPRPHKSYNRGCRDKSTKATEFFADIAAARREEAGFGIGARVMQALFLPVVALSFAAAPVVGQNFGGRRADRVRHSVYPAIGIASLMTLVLTLIAHSAPATLIRIFSRDARVIAFGSDYLRIVSLNFISAGIVFTSSSVFQGIGNTLPPLFSSLTRLILFAVPAMLISRAPGFEIRQIWYLSVRSIVLQMCVNLLLLLQELRKRL